MNASAMTSSAGSPSLLWRGASVLLFCGLPILLVALIVANLSDGFDASATAEHDDALAATIVHQLQRRQGRPDRVQDFSSIYLTSSTQTLAKAEIQDLAARLVEQASGHLIETQITDAPELQNAGKVAVQLTLDITNAGLLDLLYETETKLPLLTVPDLTVRAGNGDTQSRPSDLLRVEMVLQGALRKAAP